MAVTEGTNSGFFHRTRHCKVRFQQHSYSDKRNHIYVIDNYCMSLLGVSKCQLVLNDLIFWFVKVQNVPQFWKHVSLRRRKKQENVLQQYCSGNLSWRPLANVSITVRDINNMGDSAKEGVAATNADIYFTNKNGYKIFCKYWHPELKDGEKPRYTTVDNTVSLCQWFPHCIGPFHCIVL